MDIDQISEREKDEAIQLLALQRQQEASVSVDLDKSRRNLLLSSCLGLVIAFTGAVPTKIEALGIEFD